MSPSRIYVGQVLIVFTVIIVGHGSLRSGRLFTWTSIRVSARLGSWCWAGRSISPGCSFPGGSGTAPMHPICSIQPAQLPLAAASSAPCWPSSARHYAPASPACPRPMVRRAGQPRRRLGKPVCSVSAAFCSASSIITTCAMTGLSMSWPSRRPGAARASVWSFRLCCPGREARLSMT